MVREAQKGQRPLVADVTDWAGGDKRKFVEWRLS